MKNKICIFLVIAAVTSVAVLCIDSVEAVEYFEESDRDPDTGYHAPPGESWSWAYLYALYNPANGQYWGIKHQHDWDWIKNPPTEQYDEQCTAADDKYHPWTNTKVFYYDDGDWVKNTEADVAF
jgi:hypothetical protein